MQWVIIVHCVMAHWQLKTEYGNGRVYTTKVTSTYLFSYSVHDELLLHVHEVIVRDQPR